MRSLRCLLSLEAVLIPLPLCYAGGLKFVVNGIVYKFALDHEKLVPFSFHSTFARVAVIRVVAIVASRSTNRTSLR